MTARVTQVVVKSLGTEPSTVRLTQARIEVLGLATTGVVRMSQATLNVAANHPNPPARVSSVQLQVTAQSAPGQAQVSQVFFEMLADNINLIVARGGIKGGGAANPVRKIYANYTPLSQGALVGGSGALLQRYFFTGQGGARPGGAILRNNFWNQTTSGGARPGGSAVLLFSQFTSGGVVGGGTSTVGGFQGLTTSGGVKGGGTAPVQYIPLPTAGVKAGGTSIRTFIWGPRASGGVVGGGSVPQQQITPTFGGAVVGGLADKFGVQSVVLVGAGVRGGGTARVFADFDPRGGVRGGSTATIRMVYRINGTGGATPGGQALSPTPDYIGFGGVNCAGLARVNVTRIIPIIGGVVVAGHGIDDFVSSVSGGSLGGGTARVGRIVSNTGSGGAVCGGIAIIGRIVSNTGSGGAVCGGSHRINQFYYFPGTGGAVCNGRVDIQLWLFGQGGAVCAGTAGVGRILTNINASGGVVCGGVAPIDIGFVASGGAVLNGGNTINQFYYFPGTGGAVVRPRSLLNTRKVKNRGACRQDDDNMCCVRKPDDTRFEVTDISLSNGQVEGKLAAVAVCRLRKYKKKSYSNFEGQITKRFVKPVTKRSNTTLYR
jgi:hypothetical protein